MPIYEYECQHCQEMVTKLQKVSDQPLKNCPACEQPELRKLVSKSGFRLNGSGWYETDFKDKPKASKPQAKANTEAKTTTETKAKTETSTTKTGTK